MFFTVRKKSAIVNIVVANGTSKPLLINGRASMVLLKIKMDLLKIKILGVKNFH